MKTQVINQHQVTINEFNYSRINYVVKDNGYRLYGNISMTDNGGSIITEGSFSKVQVWMEPTKVRFGGGADQTVVLPGPNPMTISKPIGQYPEAPMDDLVIVQCEGGVPASGSQVKATYTAMAITATSEANAQTIELDPFRKGVFIAFNDQRGTYADNRGEVQVYVKLIP
ncbi:MAG: hypothetical protein AAGN35_25145 [Bacteroidota bacterium]